MKKNKKIFVLLCLLLLLSRSTVFAQNQSITNTGGNAALTLRVVKARSYMVEVPAKLSVTQADAVNAESTPPTIEFKVSGKNIILPDPINMNLAVRVSGSYPKDETATLQSGFKVAKIGGTRTRLVDYKVFDQDKKEVAANGVLAQF
ncbi:MAG: hypothetical protein RR614_14920, partial [Eubacterium sp.]